MEFADFRFEREVEISISKISKFSKKKKQKQNDEKSNFEN